MTVITLPWVIISNGTSPWPITDPILTPTPFYILLEDSSYLLLEDGWKIEQD